MLRRRINVRANAVEVGSSVLVGTPKTHKVRSVPVIASLLPVLARQCEGKVPDDLVGHKCAAMTLDVYADLFDDDLETLATRLDDHRLSAIVSVSRPMALVGAVR